MRCGMLRAYSFFSAGTAPTTKRGARSDASSGGVRVGQGAAGRGHAKRGRAWPPREPLAFSEAGGGSQGRGPLLRRAPPTQKERLGPQRGFRRGLVQVKASLSSWRGLLSEQAPF